MFANTSRPCACDEMNPCGASPLAKRQEFARTSVHPSASNALVASASSACCAGQHTAFADSRRSPEAIITAVRFGTALSFAGTVTSYRGLLFAIPPSGLPVPPARRIANALPSLPTSCPAPSPPSPPPSSRSPAPPPPCSPAPTYPPPPPQSTASPSPAPPASPAPASHQRTHSCMPRAPKGLPASRTRRTPRPPPQPAAAATRTTPPATPPPHQ